MLKDAKQLDKEIVILVNLGIAKVCKDKKICEYVEPDKSVYDAFSILKITPKDLNKGVDLFKSVKKQYGPDIKLTKVLDYLNTMITYLNSGSDDSWNKLMKMYYELRQGFVKIIENIKTPKIQTNKLLVKYLYSVTKKYASVDVDDIVMSFSDIKALKSKNKKEYEQYTKSIKALYSNISDIVKITFMKTSKQYLSLYKINEILDKYDIPPLYHGKLDKICLMNINMTLFNNSKIKLTHNIPPYGFEIVVNDKYDSTQDNGYVYKFKSYGSTTFQFVFSEAYRKSANKMKYKKVWATIDNIDKFHKKWINDMNSKDPIKMQLGLACEIIYETAMRIGNDGNKSNNEDTYGLLTLLGQHVRCESNKAEIQFKGKGGGLFEYSIDGVIFNKLCALKGKPKQKIFTINSEKLNNYLRKVLGMEITIHKFRTIKSTKIAYDLLVKDNPCSKNKKLNPKQKMEYFKKSVEQIAEMLKHHSGNKITINTAIKNYIDPLVLNKYFELCKLPAPKQIKMLLEYNNPDPEALPDIPDTTGIKRKYTDKKLTFWTRYFPM